jgi:hypothetical protein
MLLDPVPLKRLFTSWKSNEKLSDIDLRRKALALCAFMGMFRPKDASLLKQVDIHFGPNLEWVDSCLLGFKTDGQYRGETFCIWSASVSKLCSVLVLYEHMQRTSRRELVFEFDPKQISTILKSVIIDAGVNVTVFTARTFKSGGATSRIKNGV